MPLPTSGQISFADLNSELGNASTSQLDLDTAAIEFSIPTKPHGMDEFYGLTLSTLSVDPTSFTFNLAGGFKDFTTVTRSGNTVVTDNQSWLSISNRTNSGFRLTATTQVVGSLARSGTVTVSNDTDTISVPITQNAYPATLTMTPNDNFNLNSSGTGIAASITSNTNWSFSSVADWINISSISGTSGTTAITISADSQSIGAAARTDDIILSTNAPGQTNVSITGITISQEAGPLPTFTSANISITGFDVDANGTISTVTVTPAASSIVYSTANGGGGTTVIPPSKFALVGVDTTRYVTATVTVPYGYSNTGTSVSRTVEVVQEEKFYGSDEISISGFSVDADGVVTQPTVSATGVLSSNITVTYDGGASVLTKGYPLIGSDTTRTVTATVTIPSGWFNSGQQSRSVTDVQEAATLTGWIYYPYGSTSQTREIGGTLLDDVTVTYQHDNVDTTATFQFSVRTNFTTPFIVTEFGSGVLYEYGGLNSVSSVTFDSQVDGITPYARHFEIRVPIPGPGGTNTSTVNVRPTGFSGYDTEFRIVVNRGSTPTVSPTVSPTVKIIQEQ